ncbi:MAG: dTDP-4-dehydrorhamnose reductase [Candidatus Aminicenantes bacterium]|nr:dTDP-4-dehydrorhamnose reductase [Candidatus Aminicenantes bacterium]
MEFDRGIWLTGADGMLGRQLAAAFAEEGLPCHASDREVDIRDRHALEGFARGRRIGWIVNCAAYTAVDRAEDEPDAALAVNAAGVENLARLAAGRGARFIHFSTDYVFAGDRPGPYREDEPPRPLSRYGWSKWQGELRLAAVHDRFFLFRVSWLYGVHGPNFVHTMLRLFREGGGARVVNDQFGSPTYAALLAANIAGLIASGSERFGVYHYCDRGVISWFDFAAAVRDLGRAAGRIEGPVALEAVSTAAYSGRAPRPARVVLNSGKAERELGFLVRDWRQNLGEFFRETARRPGAKP